MKKHNIYLLAILVVLMFTGCGLFETKTTGYVVNEERTKSGMPVSAGMEMYGAKDEDIWFLYPEGETVEYDEKNGVTIYAAKKGRTPYLMISAPTPPVCTPRSSSKPATTSS